MTYEELKRLFITAQTSGPGAQGQQSPDAGDMAKQVGLNMVGYIPTGFGQLIDVGDEPPPPHQFFQGPGLAKYTDPNNILNQGPHQGRGAFQELAGNPDIPGDIRAIAQRFMGEQDASAIQDEGSTSYGDVANAKIYAEQIAAKLRALGPERLQTLDTITGLPGPERDAYRQGLLLSGQSLDDQERAKLQAQFLIERLIQNGVAADDAIKLQEGLLKSRGDQLSSVTQDFFNLTQAVANKLITPEQLREIGAQYGAQVDQLIQEGKDLGTEFAPRVKALTQKMESEIPGIRSLAQDVGTVAEDIRTKGAELGAFDQERFDRRFKPAFRRLKDEYDLRAQELRESMNSRGIAPGSEQEAYQMSLLEREFNKEISNLTLGAQAQAEGQELAEYSSRGQIEPAAYMQRLQAGMTPFEALRSTQESTLNEMESRLRLHAVRGEDVAQKGEQYAQGRDELTTRQNIAAQGVDAQAQTYDRRKAEMEQANQRFGATYGTAVGNLSVPQTERLQIASEATTANTQARLGYAAKMHEINTQRKLAGQQMINNMVGGVLGAGGAALGGYLSSDPATKENIEDIPEAGEGFLKLLRQVKPKTWNYKGDPTPHVGPMSTEVPEEMASPDRKGIDVINTLGILEGAVKELDTKIRRMGGGFNSLKEVV